jgi:hypothetical protein
MTTDTASSAASDAAAADAALARLEDAVRRIGDGDLHRAHRGGGWTVTEVISHINVCTLMWMGDLHRLRHDPDLSFFFREEIGHDLTGYPPPTVDIAVRQLASTRRTVASCLPATEEEVLARTVEIPDLGEMTVAEWHSIIIGHVGMHVDQALDIMRDRGFAPEGV